MPTTRSNPSRARAAELMQRQRARERRRSTLLQGGIVVGVVVAVLLVTVAVLEARDGADEPAAAPRGVGDDGSYLVGNPDAAVTVTVVEDFQCPACRAFEAVSGDQLEEWAAGDDVAVAYRGVAFLDRASSTDYSSRALNAAACTSDQGEDVWTGFHRSLYEQQPSEGGAGLTDDDLVELAVAAGAEESDVRPCVSDGRYRTWVSQTTDQAAADGVDSTPTVLVNGEETDARTPEELQAAVDQALEDAA